jgi:hypothetical protein
LKIELETAMLKIRDLMSGASGEVGISFYRRLVGGNDSTQQSSSLSLPADFENGDRHLLLSRHEF